MQNCSRHDDVRWSKLRNPIESSMADFTVFSLEGCLLLNLAEKHSESDRPIFRVRLPFSSGLAVSKNAQCMNKLASCSFFELLYSVPFPGKFQ